MIDCLETQIVPSSCILDFVCKWEINSPFVGRVGNRCSNLLRITMTQRQYEFMSSSIWCLFCVSSTVIDIDLDMYPTFTVATRKVVQETNFWESWKGSLRPPKVIPFRDSSTVSCRPFYHYFSYHYSLFNFLFLTSLQSCQHSLLRTGWKSGFCNYLWMHTSTFMNVEHRRRLKNTCFFFPLIYCKPVNQSTIPRDSLLSQAIFIFQGK